MKLLFQAFMHGAILRKLRIMTSPNGTIELSELVLPALSNHHGHLFAGQGLQLMAKAAFLAARGLAQCEVVIAGISGVDFVAPVPVGYTLILRAWVSRVGRSSMTVCVNGLSEAPGAPRESVLNGVFDMVAVDAQGRPTALHCAYINQEISA